MTKARPEDYTDLAEELLPGLIVGADGVETTQQAVARALADEWNRGYKQAREDR